MLSVVQNGNDCLLHGSLWMSNDWCHCVCLLLACSSTGLEWQLCIAHCSAIGLSVCVCSKASAIGVRY